MSIKYPIFHTGKGHLMFFHGWEPKKTQNGKELFRGCPACFLILKGVVISSHETNRFS